MLDACYIHGQLVRVMFGFCRYRSLAGRNQIAVEGGHITVCGRAEQHLKDLLAVLVDDSRDLGALMVKVVERWACLPGVTAEPPTVS